jgi:hypothetical protein
MKTAIFSWIALLCLLISVKPSNAQDSINITTTKNYSYHSLLNLDYLPTHYPTLFLLHKS